MAENSGTGTSLTVVKDALIADYMAQTRPAIRTQRTRPLKADMMAVLHGQQAAGAAVLSRPLEAGEDAAVAEVSHA